MSTKSWKEKGQRVVTPYKATGGYELTVKGKLCPNTAMSILKVKEKKKCPGNSATHPKGDLNI